jgi:hypothetical protein
MKNNKKEKKTKISLKDFEIEDIQTQNLDLLIMKERKKIYSGDSCSDPGGGHTGGGGA